MASCAYVCVEVDFHTSSNSDLRSCRFKLVSEKENFWGSIERTNVHWPPEHKNWCGRARCLKKKGGGKCCQHEPRGLTPPAVMQILWMEKRNKHLTHLKIGFINHDHVVFAAKVVTGLLLVVIHNPLGVNHELVLVLSRFQVYDGREVSGGLDKWNFLTPSIPGSTNVHSTRQSEQIVMMFWELARTPTHCCNSTWTPLETLWSALHLWRFSSEKWEMEQKPLTGENKIGLDPYCSVILWMQSFFIFRETEGREIAL